MRLNSTAIAAAGLIAAVSLALPAEAAKKKRTYTTRAGYTFGGWNTKADGTGTPYAPTT